MKLSSFIVWRALIFLFVVFSFVWLPYRKDFNRGGEFFTLTGSLMTATNFDGEYYVKIAQNGYKDLYSEAFFPLYPAVIRFFSFNYIPEEVTAILLSNFFIFISLGIFIRLSNRIMGDKVTPYATLSLILFPTAFFFTNIYTESLFLLLVLSSFWQLEKDNYFNAGIFAALASGCRVGGVFLFIAILVKWIVDKKYKKIVLSEILGILISPVGLVSYMKYLLDTHSDPFYFATVQKYFGANRTTNEIVMLPQVIYRYIKMIFTVNYTSPVFFIMSVELLLTLFFLGLLIYSWKKIPLHYFTYFLLSFIAPTLTGTFTSMPRYLLTIFPGFFMLGSVLMSYPKLRSGYLLISVILLCILTGMFSRGYFVG